MSGSGFQCSGVARLSRVEVSRPLMSLSELVVDGEGATARLVWNKVSVFRVKT
jgi:hypothetical protein